ncbi:MAG: hypothetical protein ACTHOE_01015 [Conexibacter sp.]
MELLAFDDVVELLQLRTGSVDRPWRQFGVDLGDGSQPMPILPDSIEWVDRSALPAALADAY